MLRIDFCSYETHESVLKVCLNGFIAIRNFGGSMASTDSAYCHTHCCQVNLRGEASPCELVYQTKESTQIDNYANATLHSHMHPHSCRYMMRTGESVLLLTGRLVNSSFQPISLSHERAVGF